MDEELKFNWRRLEEQGVLASEKAKPSSAPEHWAKRGCNRCNGRGTVGYVTIKHGSNTIKNAQMCSCATKRFVKWRNDFVANYVKEHREIPILESVDIVDKAP